MKKLTVKPSQLTTSNSFALEKPTTSLHDDALYARLVQIFKQGFVTINGESPDQDWCDLFDRMSPDQLRRGVANARDKKKQALRAGNKFFPPDADEFEVYCTSPRADDPANPVDPYYISEGLKGTCRYYQIDFEGKREDQVNELIWEAQHKT
jgi:hypothetical protein